MGSFNNLSRNCKDCSYERFALLLDRSPKRQLIKNIKAGFSKSFPITKWIVLLFFRGAFLRINRAKIHPSPSLEGLLWNCFTLFPHPSQDRIELVSSKFRSRIWQAVIFRLSKAQMDWDYFHRLNAKSISKANNGGCLALRWIYNNPTGDWSFSRDVIKGIRIVYWDPLICRIPTKLYQLPTDTLRVRPPSSETYSHKCKTVLIMTTFNNPLLPTYQALNITNFKLKKKKFISI